ncbi:cytochrome c3 family protein [Desulfosporosinus metallidurans]|uniref:Cytochrome c family protein n=1 Tax=Desulfosporosinus metallidurans TaxID=1888891 RepID=A0A1Q8QZQ3_9FIRM|nr:cytochrome c3 family protein [Desulfosporosinus metallidurans]OLN32795.1 Cytochrome c family protein [Desulfosporosinus metallidurans]
MKKTFLLASLLLILIVILALKQENTPSWTRYQRDYFTEQISKLQVQLGTINDSTKKNQLQQELASYQTRKPEIINLVLPNGKVERCKTCHIGIEEISNSHPSNTFGCAVCHGGNPLSLDKTTAHAQMYGGGHPGSLDVASLSCGGTGANGVACHTGNHEQAKNEVDLVKTSIMSTKAGELSVVRMMFGFDKTKDVPGLTKGQVGFLYPNPLQGRPNEKDFQQNCLSQCHQSGGDIPTPIATKNPHPEVTQGKVQAESKAIQGNGCEVCHVLTNPTHTYIGADTTMKSSNIGRGKVHSLTTQIPYTQCNQCHNQGNHDPLKMSFAIRSDMTKVVNDWKAGDTNWLDRLKDYYLPGEIFAQCEVSLDCIDCHTRQDVMGDNKLYTSQYDAVHLQCQDCHGTKEKLPQTKIIKDTNDLAFEEQITNSKFPELKIGNEILMTAKGEELPFTRHQGNDWVQSSRVTGKTFKIPLVYGSKCQQSLMEQGADSCHKCHNRSASHP